MIAIQIIIIVALILLALNFMRSRHTSRTRAYKKILLLLFIPSAIVTVIFPEVTTVIAHSVGVGRGADLLLYCLTVMVIIQLFNTYIKDKENFNKLVVLSRKIAIIEANASGKTFK